MSDKLFSHFLRFSGWTTVLGGAALVLPELWLKLGHVSVTEPAGLFYVRHWGLMACCVGALIVCAAGRPALRRPVLLAALVEKLGLVLLVALGWNDLSGMAAAAAFDAMCVVVYAVWWWRGSSASPTAR